MTEAFTKQQFIENEARLRAALGGEDDWLARFKDRTPAEKALAGEVAFCFPMTTDSPLYFAVGRSHIDWSGQHHKHQEWPAQLNRFFMAAALANAYRETGNEDFAHAARDYISDWIDAHPAADRWDKADCDSTLNMCIRLSIWGAAVYEFRDSCHFDEAFFCKLVGSFECQLDYLCSHYSRSGNWRIANADGVLINALRLRQLPGSACWIRSAVRVLNEAFHRQVLPDGAHIERNPGYHIWMTSVFSRLWRVGRACPDLGLAMAADVITRMHDYAAAVTKPNGYLNGVHDCEGQHTGRSEAWQLANRAEFRKQAGLDDAMPPTSQAFPDAGQACWRSGWDDQAVYVAFDASTWGGGHCHLGRNSVQLHAYGRSLLVDPGTLNYESRDPMMALGKSTRAHNTVSLNGWNQCEADPSSRFESLPGYDIACGHYNGGYWPHPYYWGFRDGHGTGLWGSHHRTVLWVRDSVVVVFDRVRFDAREAPEEPLVESNWQFSRGRVHLDPEARCATTDHEDANALVLFPPSSVPDRLDVHEGVQDPLRAWLMAGDGSHVSAPQVSLTCRTERSFVDMVTVLVPFQGKQRPSLEAETLYNHHGKLTLKWGDGRSDVFYWAYELGFPLDECDEVTTDASLVHLLRDRRNRVHGGMAMDATFLQPYTRKKLRKPRSFTFRI